MKIKTSTLIIIALVVVVVFLLVRGGDRKQEQLAHTGRVLDVAEVNKPAAPEKEFYTVLKVIDGDTFNVADDAGVQKIIRVIGIDAPETTSADEKVECFGQEASAKANEFLQGKTITLEADDTQGDKDIYGRFLRYIFLSDGTNFNKLMIAEGYAYEYTYDVPYKYQEEFKLAQKEAEKNKRGLWAVCYTEPELVPVPVIQQAPTPEPKLELVPVSQPTVQPELEPIIEPEPEPIQEEPQDQCDSAECDDSDGWINSGVSYACCNGNSGCACQGQEYRDYYCGNSSCEYSVTNTKIVKDSCFDCGSGGYCSSGECQPIEVEPSSVPPQSSDCSSNVYNCSDFSIHSEAQAVFDACGGVGNDVHGLDRDKDGIACESLP